MDQEKEWCMEHVTRWTGSESYLGANTLLAVRTKTYGSHAFAHAGPKLYNTLPEEIRLAPTYNTFRARLKTHLFCLAYDT